MARTHEQRSKGRAVDLLDVTRGRTRPSRFELKVGDKWAQHVRVLRAKHDIDALEATDHVDVILDGANVTLFCEREPVLAWVNDLARGVCRVNQVPYGHVELEFAHAPYILSLQREADRGHVRVLKLHPWPSVHACAMGLKWKNISRAVWALGQEVARALHPSPHSDALRAMTSVAPASHGSEVPRALTRTFSAPDWSATLVLPAQRDLGGYTGLFAVTGELVMPQAHERGGSPPLLELYAFLEREGVTPAWFDAARALLPAVSSHLPQLAHHDIIRAMMRALDERAPSPPKPTLAPHADPVTLAQPPTEAMATGLPWSFAQTRALYPHVAWSWSHPSVFFDLMQHRDQVILCPARDGLWALEPTRGEVLWRAPHEGLSHAVFSQDHGWLTSPSSTRLVSLSDGARIAQCGHDTAGAVLLTQSRVHALRLNEDHTLSCLRHVGDTLEQVWVRAVDASALVCVCNGVAYVSHEGALQAVSVQTGEVVETFDVRGSIVRLAALFGHVHAFVRRAEQMDVLECALDGQLHARATIPNAVDVLDMHSDEEGCELLLRTWDHTGLSWVTLTQGALINRWEIRGEWGMTGRMSLHGSDVIVHTRDAQVWCMRRADAFVRWCIQDEDLSTQGAPLGAHCVRDGCCVAGQEVHIRDMRDGSLIHRVTQTVDTPAAFSTASPFGLVVGERGGASSGEDVIYRLDFGHYLAVVK